MSLYLKWASCRQHIDSWISFLKIFSDKVFLIDAFRLLMFKVIIGIVGSISTMLHLLFSFHCIHSLFLSLSCTLSLFFVCVILTYFYWNIFDMQHCVYVSLPRWLSGKEFTCQCRRCKRCGFYPWVRKIPWSRKWQPANFFCLENAMDKGVWPTTVHGVSKSRTWLSK